tara:strand:+ start:1932 stop:2585 length:654 start_codon:yes stop_codon:yes gene_type:complete
MFLILIVIFIINILGLISYILNNQYFNINKYVNDNIKNIVVIGDSLGTGYGLRDTDDIWVNKLKDKLDNTYDIINFSKNDRTTGEAIKIVEKSLFINPEVIIIMLGGNDALQNLSIRNMKNNLKKMIEMCLERDIEVVFVGMPIPFKMKDKNGWTDEYMEEYVQTFYKISEEYDIIFVKDFLEMKEGNMSLYLLDDDVHINRYGQQLITDTIFKYIY